MENTGTILAHEVLAGILGINVVEQVAYEVSQYLRALVFCRNQLEAMIRCRQVELVLNLYVVGLRKVIVHPLVERISRCVGINNRYGGVIDRRREVIVVATSGEGRRHDCHTYHI